MNQSPRKILLSCMNQDAAHKIARHPDRSGVPTVVDCGYFIGLHAKGEGRCGEQSAAGAINERSTLQAMAGRLSCLPFIKFDKSSRSKAEGRR